MQPMARWTEIAKCGWLSSRGERHRQEQAPRNPSETKNGENSASLPKRGLHVKGQGTVHQPYATHDETLDGRRPERLRRPAFPRPRPKQRHFRRLRPELNRFNKVLVGPVVHIGIPSRFGNEAHQGGVHQAYKYQHAHHAKEHLMGKRLRDETIA